MAQNVNYSQYQLPVITGRNDIPSEVTDPYHPDGGLLTQLYNSLLTTIQAEVDPVTLAFNRPTTVNEQPIFYVDLVGGDDNNDGLTTGTPLATIEKALELIIPDRVLIPIIRVQGTLTDPTFDLRNVHPQSQDTLDDEYYDFDVHDSSVTIESYGTGLTINVTLSGTTAPLVIGADKIALWFSAVTFNVGVGDPILFNHQIVVFENCTFNEDGGSGLYDGLIWATHSVIGVKNCTMGTSSNSAYCLVSGTYLLLYVDGGSYQDYQISFCRYSRIWFDGSPTFNLPDEFNTEHNRSDAFYQDTFSLDNIFVRNYSRSYMGNIPIDTGHRISLLQDGTEQIGRIGGTYNKKKVTEHNIGVEIPANSAFHIEYPDLVRMANITWRALLLDPSVSIAGHVNGNDLWIITDSTYSNLNGDANQDLRDGGVWNTLINVTLWGAGDFFAHNVGDDNTNQLRRVVVHGGNANTTVGMTMDNCYPFPIFFSWLGQYLIR